MTKSKLPTQTQKTDEDFIAISGSLLKAAAAIAPTNDIRDYFNVVHIRRGAFGTLLLVTNGHMFAMHILSREPVSAGEYDFPPQPIRSALIRKSSKYCLVFDGDSAVIRTEFCDIRSIKFEGAPQFPDHKRFVPDVIDRETQGCGAVFNIDYAVKARDFIDAARGVRQSYQTTEWIADKGVADNEGRPSRVFFIDAVRKDAIDTIVVVMCIRFGSLKERVHPSAILSGKVELKVVPKK